MKPLGCFRAGAAAETAPRGAREREIEKLSNENVKQKQYFFFHFGRALAAFFPYKSSTKWSSTTDQRVGGAVSRVCRGKGGTAGARNEKKKKEKKVLLLLLFCLIKKSADSGFICPKRGSKENKGNQFSRIVVRCFSTRDQSPPA